MTSSLLVVPPLLKYTSGPLLGPAMLVGAAVARGHQADVLDLNIALLREQLSPGVSFAGSHFTGDHDKPTEALRAIERTWQARLRGLLPTPACTPRVEEPLGSLAFDHDAIEGAVAALADGPEGRWVEAHLNRYAPPALLGLSVLFSGQVCWALTIGRVARRLWPGTVIVWGGPHVTALRDVIPHDPRFGAHADGFVFGHAEQTFVDTLDWLAGTGERPRALVRAGEGQVAEGQGDASVVPVFGHLGSYGIPRLTLPAQTSRGCAYGRCSFCTYPAIEGTYREQSEASWLGVVALAVERGAVVSFKDSLVLPRRLEHIADRIRGRVRWSACTKLHPSLSESFLRKLADCGCATLEVGLETLSPDEQALIEKRQSEALFRSVVEGAASSGISLVVNYMTGFPGDERGGAAEALQRTRAIVEAAGGHVKIERNTFQLERLAPMARAPSAHGLRIVGSWPWASVLDWEPAALELRGGSTRSRRLLARSSAASFPPGGGQ